VSAAVSIVNALDGTGAPRPGLLVAYTSSTILGSAAKVGGSDQWVIYEAATGLTFLVDDERAARDRLTILGGLS